MKQHATFTGFGPQPVRKALAHTVYSIGSSILIAGSIALLLTTRVEGSNAAHSLILSESTATANCTGTDAECRINLLGDGSLEEPGDSRTETLTFRNAGNMPAALTLQSLGCSASADPQAGMFAGSDRAGFCGRLDVTVGAHGKCILPRLPYMCPPPSARTTLTSIGTSTYGVGMLDSGAATSVTITILFDPEATNADQGLEAAAPFRWALTA